MFKNILGQKIVSEITGFFFVKLASLLVGVIGSILITRMILPEEYAIYLSILVIIEVAFSFSQVGVATIYVTNKDSKEASDGITTLNYVLPIIPTIFVLIYSLNLEENFLVYLLLILLLGKILETFTVILRSEIEYQGRFTSTATIELGSKVFSYIVAFILTFMHSPLLALVAKDVTLMCLVYFAYCRIVPPTFPHLRSLKHVRVLKWQIMQLIMLRFVETIQKQIVLLVLQGKVQAAYFERSRYLTNFFYSAVQPLISKVLFVHFTRSKPSSHRKLFSLVLSAILLVSIPIYTVFYRHADMLILFVYGENWIVVVPVFKLLLLSIVLLPVRGLGEFYLLSQKLTSYNLQAKLIALLVLLSGSIMFYFENINFFEFTQIYVVSVAINAIILIFLCYQKGLKCE